MKSILVPAAGSATDAAVFETALAAARLFASHLQFLHIHLGSGEAALHTPHLGFAGGQALVNALDELQTQSDDRARAAEQHVRELCAGAQIDLIDKPDGCPRVTASWHQEDNDARHRLLFHARHNDLVVMGRARRPNGLPPDIIENLVLESGRPILLAAAAPARKLAGTVMVCWRDTPDAARAVVAATPFLERAQRVVLVAVDEGGSTGPDVEAAAAQLRWNEVATDAQVIAAKGRPAADVLREAARVCGADLVVMGAYGHSRMRELIFGGCTRAVLASADQPVLLFH
jgi:nucleotide-binding universal stress UspA family protein